jgi:hypothetical protein
MEYTTGSGPEPPGAPETAPTRVTRPLGSRASTLRSGGPGRRLATETKQAFKTTEFWIYLVILFGLLLAGLIADAGEGSDVDGFGADHVWLYAVILTVGYLISRGLAKSGSRDPYWDDPGAGDDDTSIGDRVKAAAQVLKDGPDA